MSLNYKSPDVQKTKAELLEISKMHWEAREIKKKKGEKTQQEKAKEHASDTAKYKAILSKKAGYAQRAHDYLLKDSGRNVVYHDFPHTDKVYEKDTADVFKKNAKFPGGVEANFNPKAKHNHQLSLQKYPYSWRAHHMIPGSAFYAEGKDGPIITDVQRELLMQTEYDLNHGHNIINLPAKNADVPIHSLIQHPSDHKNYTLDVMEAMKEISNDLQELIENKEPHENIVVTCFDELKDLEDTCWDFIVKLSRDSVKSVLEGAQVNSNNVKYKSSSGKTSYNWGALT